MVLRFIAYALAYFIAFPSANIEILGFFALAPVFFELYQMNLSSSLKAGLVWGCVFWSLMFYWIYHYHPLTFPSMFVAFMLYEPIRFALVSAVGKRFKESIRIWLVPAVWVGFTLIRNYGLLSFPWEAASVSQYKFTSFIQTADIFGMWFTSYLVVLVNSAVAEVLWELKKKDAKNFEVAGVWNAVKSKKHIFAVVIIFILSVAYGTVKVLVNPVVPQRSDLKVSLLQVNWDPWGRWWNRRWRVWEKLWRLSAMSTLDGAELVVWPETPAYMPLLFYYHTIDRSSEVWNVAWRYLAIPVETKTSAMVSTPNRWKYRGNSYNTVFLVLSNGVVNQYYEKIHLVLFGETVPFAELIPSFYRFLKEAGVSKFKHGSKFTVFKFKGLKFSTMICYEDMFSYLSREFVVRGADFLLNQSLDAWSESEAQQEHRLAMGVFRAVETGRPLLRAECSGVTAVVDSFGRVVEKLPQFTEGYIVSSVPPKLSYPTVYIVVGDVFPAVLIAVLFSVFVVFLFDLVRRRS